MPNIYEDYIVGKRYDIKDDYILVDPTQIPMLNALGYGDDVTQTTHSWYEDAMFATKAKLAGSLTDSATSFTVDSVEPFQVEAVIEIDGEWMLVSAVTEETKTLTVTRGYADTVAAAHTAGDIVEYKFIDSVEGRDAIEARYKARVEKSNYTQIFTESIMITGTAGAVSQYGVSDEYEKEKAKKQIELFLQLEKAITAGNKYKSSNGKTRYMGGIKSFIESNVMDAGGAAIDIPILREVTKEVYLDGGFKKGMQSYRFVAHPTQIEKLSDIMIASNTQQDVKDTTRGYTVGQILTPQGTFGIMQNSNLDDDEMLFTDLSRIDVKALKGRSFGHEFLGKKGDYTEGMLLGEYTMEMIEESAHMRIKGLGK